GRAVIGESYLETVVEILSQSFVLGVRAAGPLMISLFLATVVLGLVSRTLPQLNVLALGFGLNSFLTLAMMMLSLGAVAWTFQQPAIEALHQLQEAAVSTALPNP